MRKWLWGAALASVLIFPVSAAVINPDQPAVTALDPAQVNSAVAAALNSPGGSLTVTPDQTNNRINIDLTPVPEGTVLANSGTITQRPTPQGPSRILDRLTNQRGAGLFRGADTWTPMLPGNSGQVLFTFGPGADPAWGDLPNPLNSISAARGTLLEKGATGWTALGAGTAGQYLMSNGANADPSWFTPPAIPSGTVTSISSGAGLTGGSITGSGTLALASIANKSVLGNISGAAGVPTSTAISSLLSAANTGCASNGAIYGSLGASGIFGCLTPGTTGQYLTQGAAGPQWITLPTIPATPLYSAKTDWHGSLPVNAETQPILIAPANGTIKQMTGITGGSTSAFNVTIRIGSTNVTGCSAIIISSTASQQTCTANNIFTKGQVIYVVASTVINPTTNAMVQIDYTLP